MLVAKGRAWILALVLFSLSAQPVLSLEIPTFISFQGKLANSTSGTPYNPASVRITLTNQSQPSQVVWGPHVYNDVTDSQGVFDIILGKADALSLTPGWQYNLIAEVDINSAAFGAADLTFGDDNPSGDIILVTGGGPATAAQLLMADNSTTVQQAIEGIGGAGSAAWIDVGTVLNLNSSVASVLNVSSMTAEEVNVSGSVNLPLPAFNNCGKLYTDTGGRVACGVDAGSGADSVLWVVEAGGIMSNQSIMGGNVNVTGNITLRGITYLWPPSAGVSGQVLSTNGAGALTWMTLPTYSTAPQDNNITLLWGNASDQDQRIIALETAGTPAVDGNITGLWANASGQEAHIRVLFANDTALWGNASDQDARIRALESAGFFNSIANFTGTLTDAKVCTYNLASGRIVCNTDQSTYDDSLLVANDTLLWANVTALWANASDQNTQTLFLLTNASDQDARIIALETAGNPAADGNITALWTNASGQNVQIQFLLTNASNQDLRLIALENMGTAAQDNNITLLWSNATGQDVQIQYLLANASNQDVRVRGLESAGFFNHISNFTGPLTDTRTCTYNATTGRIDCDTPPSSYNDAALVANDTLLWGNASNQDGRIITLEQATTRVVFLNLTSGTYNGAIINGSLVGYQAANDICNRTYSNSYFCKSSDVIAYINNVNIAWFAGTAWVANGPPGYTASANDCEGWTTATTAKLGSFWQFENNGGGMGWLTNCGNTKPLACCR
jgi:hypothetical protein